MDLTTAAILLAWAPVSFLAHSGMHEGSHALAASAYGAKATHLSLLPSSDNGNFTFAHVDFDRPLRGQALTATLVAPVVSELAYLSLTTAMLAFMDLPPAARIILKAEVIASIVNMTWWWLGVWLGREHSDSMRLSRGRVPGAMEAASVLQMAPIYTLGIKLVF